MSLILSARIVTVFGERSIMAHQYTMIAKPIRALELHYPMIQFLIISIIIKAGDYIYVNHLPIYYSS